ncbi:unnamed protein product [Absidia cylindrospora]
MRAAQRIDQMNDAKANEDTTTDDECATPEGCAAFKARMKEEIRQELIDDTMRDLEKDGSMDVDFNLRISCSRRAFLKNDGRSPREEFVPEI